MLPKVDTTTGVITPKKHGTVTITAYLSGSQIMKSFTVTFTLNGTYFLRNLETELYADIQSGTMSNGNEIEQQTFDGANTQKWVFTHVGSNVYTIHSSKNTAYYLGVQNDSTTDGTNIVLRTGTATSGMKWRIEAGNEGYQIVSYADSTMVLATNSSGATAGQKLILAEYEDDTDYRDEWDIVACSYDYIFNVIHYYDQGYDARFANAGEDIDEYQSVCSNILFDVFGIELNYSIYNYTSCADTCTGVPTTYSDTTTSCSHTNVDHKMRSSIRNDLISQYGNGTSILTRVAWTGHVLESRSSNSSSGSHTIVLTIGMVTNQSTNDCYRCDHGLTEPPICVMSKRMRDLETRLNNGNAHTIYCDQCKSSTHAKGILTHLKNHH